jgi:hypothetical protein
MKKFVSENLFKLMIVSSLLITSFNTFAQLKTVYASGGQVKVNWDYLFKQNEENEDEYPFIYGSGCTESPSTSYASSTLSSQGTMNYYSTNLHDWDPRTAWVEGKTDYGIGQYFDVDLPYGGSNVGIFNGYQKSYEAWLNNSRVKKIKVYGDNKPLCYLVLNDNMGCQTFDIPSQDEFDVYRFEIVEVYPGVKWKDVAISEITNLGCCFNTNTSILQTQNKTEFVTELYPGSIISSVDILTNEPSDNKIVKMVKLTHHTLLRVQTKNNLIELTPYHPLYIKNIGLTSLYKLKKSQVFCSYEEMINQLEVLVWNDQLKICEYIPITNIEILTGNFDTYSIEELKFSKNYIINGFVTSVY